MASSFSSSSSARSWKYDVFLSFRGEDTRKNFVDHLYFALEQQAIATYKDDVTLDRGDVIGPSLLSAIESSQILVIIFSENYADSSWCLDELSHIMKCRDSKRGQIVFPIFYHVDPSDVRKQKRKYGEAFAIHEQSEKNKEKVESWKEALVDASNIAGWVPKFEANGYEAKCIQQIVGSILDKLLSLNSNIDNENLVGIGTRLQDLESQLRIGSGGVRMVGIWGMGGGGKTTLATSLYKKLKISGLFNGCCLLENIREESKHQKGLKHLQKKILSAMVGKKIDVESVDTGKQQIKDMLCRKNVLIVLDDVDRLDQLKALVGSLSWFGDGSRIIITTRDKHLLETHRVVVSPINLLSPDEAIRLFKKHAYNEDKPVHDYEMLSQQIVSYAGGLPLALIVLGSFLYDKNYNEWLSTLARLKEHPDMDILEKLKISYDGLQPLEKELFLDIACFQRGELKDEAMEILDACGFHPQIGVKVLIQKALISVSKDDEFEMHDLVQEMGHYIVKGEHPNNPEKYTRIWRKEDIEDICSRNAKEQNNMIKGLQGWYGHSSFNMLVSNMKKIRFLKVWNKSNDDGGPSFLSNELRYLQWGYYLASPFPESFQPKKLVVLKIEESLQKELWNGKTHLPSLKELKLQAMRELVRTPDFGGLPCLKKLTLYECSSLKEIHQSLGDHSTLVFVEVIKCEKLTRLPSIVGMEKLEILKIEWCEALVEFPKIEANLDNLKELSLKNVGIEVLPSSVGEYCTNLISLKLEYCGKLKSIEGSLDALKCLEIFHVHMKYLFSNGVGFLSQVGFLSHQLPLSLRKLDLSNCGLNDGEMPNEVGELSNLQELNLSWNNFTRLDFSLLRLARLKLLNLSYCFNLAELPELPSSLAILKANGCVSLEDFIRDEIHTNCKCLSQVLITGVYGEDDKDIKGGERLLETMLFQGNVVESGCICLILQGSKIARGFIPRLVRGKGCRMQLPDNWCNDFSGFLFCTINNFIFNGWKITMKHVQKLEGDSQHDENMHWDEAYGDKKTWVGYISFDLLSQTTWWDPTSMSIQMEIKNKATYFIGWGWKLVPKRGGGQSSGQTRTHSSSSQISFNDDDYKYKLYIQHDSKSALKCVFSDIIQSKESFALFPSHNGTHRCVGSMIG